MDDARLQAYEPAPGAHAYTAFHGLARPLRFGGRGGRRLPGELRRVGCQLRPHEPRASRPLRAHREDRAGRALEGARGVAEMSENARSLGLHVVTVTASSMITFGRFTSSLAAFEKECWLYHTFNPADNGIHPARPQGSNSLCSWIGCTARSVSSSCRRIRAGVGAHRRARPSSHSASKRARSFLRLDAAAHGGTASRPRWGPSISHDERPTTQRWRGPPSRKIKLSRKIKRSSH